jgi:hypothetical protein
MCGSESVGHDAFTTRFVDGRHARIGDGHGQTATSRGESGGQSGGAAANHEEICRDG